MSLYDTLHPLASAMGIPDRLWLTVTQAESGFNPSAIGDNGTSFGLLQLHVGGQAPVGIPTSQLLDPATNFKYGLPAIKKAWDSLGSSFDNSITWWQNFAALSGHPGGSPGQTVTDNEAARLQSIYTTNNFGSIVASGGLGTIVGSGGTIPVSTGSGSPLDGIATFMDNIGLDILIFTIAITIFIVGIGVLK